MTDTQVTWLTEEAHDRLKAELEQLIAHRPVIAAEINPYHMNTDRSQSPSSIIRLAGW